MREWAATDSIRRAPPPRPALANVVRILMNLVRRNRFDESLLTTIVGHFETLALMRHPYLKPLLQKDPYAPFRPFRTYLSPTFSRSQRRELLQEHYRHLTNSLCESFFSQIVVGAPMLWELSLDRDRAAITISMSECQFEGDLLLEFQLNNEAIFHVSMSVAPGHLVGSTAVRAILVARVQGVRGKWEEIRRATKMCSDVSPPFVLMSAVQAFARAIDITCIAGVRNSQKEWLLGQQNPDMRFDYDNFWRQLSSTVGANFCLMPVPMVSRPIEQVSVNHRRRTMAKRQFKQRVEDTVYDRLATEFREPDPDGTKTRPPPSNACG